MDGFGKFRKKNVATLQGTGTVVMFQCCRLQSKAATLQNAKQSVNVAEWKTNLERSKLAES